MKPICKYITQINFLKKPSLISYCFLHNLVCITHLLFYAKTTWLFGYCFLLYPDFSRKFFLVLLNIFLTIPLLCWLLYNWFIKFYKVHFGDLDQHVFKLTDLSAKMKPFQYPRICCKKKRKSRLGKKYIPSSHIECQKRQFSKDK